MASSNNFTYSHELEGRTIRLLRLSLEPKEGVLNLRLVVAKLDEARFEALSYVWGTQSSRELVKCDGRWFSIGSNLHDALLERRRRESKALLWADQICIDQSNNHEKTHQVRMMRDIYATADQVIIWLGKRQPEDPKAFQLVKTLYHKYGGDKYDIDAGIYDFEDFDSGLKGVPGPLDPAWMALFNIITHPWFGRVWVIQELLVAEKSTMWRGSLDLDTKIILWSAMQVGRHRDLYQSFNNFMKSPRHSALTARNIAAGFFDHKKKGRLPIYDILSRHPGMGATDLRDRYFALAGLSAGLDPAFVSYEKTFQEIACLVGKMTLLGAPGCHITPTGIEMLTFQQDPRKRRFPIDWLTFNANPQNHKLDIPSWVPDLLSPHSPGLIMSGFYNTENLLGDRAIPNPQLRLGRQQPVPSDPSAILWEVPVPNEIHIKGAIFDVVDLIAEDRPPLPLPSNSNSNINFLFAIKKVSQYEGQMVHWLSNIRKLADPTLNPRDSVMAGSSFDTFWRTLVYNRGTSYNYDAPNRRPGAGLALSFGYWYLFKKFQMMKRFEDGPLKWVCHTKILEKLAAPFEEAEARVREARKFFVSPLGRIGWVPFRTKVGDQICVFFGMRVPVVLRHHGERWEFIGACYVHGVMDGEAWDLEGLQWDFMSFV